jgi:hypothetical protein
MFPISLAVAGSLAIVLRPRGGDWLDDDVRRLTDHGTQVVVSLSCESECVELGLEEEAAACARHQLAVMAAGRT